MFGVATGMYDSSIHVEGVGFRKPGCDQQHLQHGHRDAYEWTRGAVGMHAAFGHPEEVADC